MVGRYGREGNRQLCIQKLQTLLFGSEVLDLFLQSPVLHLQLVQGL